MATLYWVATGNPGTLKTSNTAANWNTSADGTGSTGTPSANDHLVYGHPDTVAANKGFAACNFNQALTLDEIVVYEDYDDASKVLMTEKCVFSNSASTLTIENGDFLQAGFFNGMVVRISGAFNTGNNAEFTITNLTSTVLTTSGTFTDETIAGRKISITGQPSYLEITQDLTLSGMYLNGTIKSSNTLSFAGTYISDGDKLSPVSYGQRFLLNGPKAAYNDVANTNMKFDQTSNSSNKLYFDDGPYPTVTIDTASALTCSYLAPTSEDWGEAFFYKFLVTNDSATMVPVKSASMGANDAKKVFNVSGDTSSTFSFSGAVFDVNTVTWKFVCDNGTLPCNGDTTNFGGSNATFFSRFGNLVIYPSSTAGNRKNVAQNGVLECKNLFIETGASLRGSYEDETNSVLHAHGLVDVRGSWNFRQISEGIYHSNPDYYALDVSHGGTGLRNLASNRIPYGNGQSALQSNANFVFDHANSRLGVGLSDPKTKLTVEGAITLKEQANADADTAAYGQLWTKTATPNELYFTNDAGNDIQITSGSSLAGGGGSYTDADAIAAVEGESTLDLTGAVTIQTDLKMTTSSDNAIIENVTQDKDIIFQVNDGGSANTEVMRIDGSTSRVGIGTTTPSTKLEVVGDMAISRSSDSGQTRTLSIEGARFATGNDYARIDLENYDSSANYVGARIAAINEADGVDDGTLAFSTANAGTLAERMRITDTGNVGIGTNAPDAPLHVETTGTDDSLIVESTSADANHAPDIIFYRNSSSPADNDGIGHLRFRGRNDNSQDVLYADIYGTIRDASDTTEDGEMNIRTVVAGTLANRIHIDPTETVMNEDSHDLDFRVESNSDANALFVEAGTDRVGIRQSSPDATLDVGDGYTFRSTHLLTVSSSSSTLNLTVAAHAGRYILYSGSSGTVNLPSNASAGEHYTILNVTGGNITVGRNGNNINGAASDITLGSYKGLTCICIDTSTDDWIALGA